MQPVSQAFVSNMRADVRCLYTKQLLQRPFLAPMMECLLFILDLTFCFSFGKLCAVRVWQIQSYLHGMVLDICYTTGVFIRNRVNSAYTQDSGALFCQDRCTMHGKQHLQQECNPRWEYFFPEITLKYHLEPRALED